MSHHHWHGGGQRCSRTIAKHLASSINAERLTKSDTAMMAEAPRESRSATPVFAFAPDLLSPTPRSRPHHPGTQQEPTVQPDGTTSDIVAERLLVTL